MFKKIKELLGVVDDSKWGLEIRKKKDFDRNKTTGALYGYEPNDEEIDFSTSKIELFTPTVLDASCFNSMNCCGENLPFEIERSFS